VKRRKWIERAEEWERKARMAYEVGDEHQAEWYLARAKACRFNANYGIEESEDGTEKPTDRSPSNS